MRKSPAIFQEIETKLAKDDYASKLPAYHPAKGRRKRIVKEPDPEYLLNNTLKGNSEAPNIGFTQFSEEQSQDPVPETPPEIERPGEERIFPPGEKEIDPSRDFPQRDIPSPEEEEIPQEEPRPEVEDPGGRDGIF